MDTALIVISKAQPVGSGSPQRGEMPAPASQEAENQSLAGRAVVFNHTQERDMYDEPDDLDEPQPSPQATGSVKVNASLIEYDAERMFDAIVRTAAHQIVEQARGDIRKAVTDEVRIAIQSSVGAIIEKTVNEPIQQRNSYGEKVGEPTTLKAIIGKAGEDYLGARVNERGEASGYGGNSSSRLDYIVKKNVESVIDYKMQQEIKKAVEAAVAAAQMKVAEAVAKLIK